jgi:hypothetical protein
MTILYTPGGPGRGKATRTAALARRLSSQARVGQVHVIHGTAYSTPFDWAGISHSPGNLESAQRYASDLGDNLLVDGDDFYRLNQKGKRTGIDMEITPFMLPFPHEIMSREDARAFLGFAADEHVLFVLRNVYHDTISPFLGAATSGWTLADVVPYPAAVYMRAADAVIGNAGYNLHWETKLLNIPAFLIPDPRGTDQLLRTSPKTIDEFSDFLRKLEH